MLYVWCECNTCIGVSISQFDWNIHNSWRTAAYEPDDYASSPVVLWGNFSYPNSNNRKKILPPHFTPILGLLSIFQHKQDVFGFIHINSYPNTFSGVGVGVWPYPSTVGDRWGLTTPLCTATHHDWEQKEAPRIAANSKEVQFIQVKRKVIPVGKRWAHKRSRNQKLLVGALELLQSPKECD